MNFKEKYDAVKAVFPIAYILDDSRFDFLPEPQICVKNFSIVSNIQKYSKDVVPPKYDKFIFDYSTYKEKLKMKRINKYKTKLTNIKYKI